MSFKDLNIDIQYDSDLNDLVIDFYNPVLKEAICYDRITGFFSSSSLAVAACGLESLIRNGGTMRLITCQRLSKEDIAIIEKSQDSTESVLLQNFIQDYDSITDEFERNHVKALGWLLAQKKLDVRIALIYKNGHLCTEEEVDNSAIFHQKIGILQDTEGNMLSFSGSINESASGWLGNVEEFKVFKGWMPVQKDYFEKDAEKFNYYWDASNKYSKVHVYGLPAALEEKLIEIGSNFEIESIKAQNYIDKRHRKKKLTLFDYQDEAVAKWIANSNKLLFEMATGTGKTRTSFGCIKVMLDQCRRILIIVACPQNTLLQQWKADFDCMDIDVNDSVIIDGTVKNWRALLQNEVGRLNNHIISSCIIFTTHKTASSKDFVEIVESLSEDIPAALIADEAHGMGANKAKHGLLDRYSYRIGLSATPRRWFDEIGTAHLYEYFDDDAYEFTINDALTKYNPATGKHFLVDFYYRPVFINLTEDELKRYQALTRSIINAHTKTKKGKMDASSYERLLFLRANIEKNAVNKYGVLRELLNNISDDITGTIIFVSPEQLNKVLEILNEYKVTFHPFTEKQGTKKEKKFGDISEREFLVGKFRSGECQVLVAIKCLDEGIDVPSAKRAIVMASSTNPREYIQRVGRVIRQSEGKTRAEIYDMIIRPDLNNIDEGLRKIEKRIFEKELDRVEDLSLNSINSVDVLKIVTDIREELLWS